LVPHLVYDQIESTQSNWCQQLETVVGPLTS
jgi:hypothetical protein